MEQKKFMKEYIESKGEDYKFGELDIDDFFKYITHQIEVERSQQSTHKEYFNILKDFLETHQVVVNV